MKRQRLFERPDLSAYQCPAAQRASDEFRKSAELVRMRDLLEGTYKRSNFTLIESEPKIVYRLDWVATYVWIAVLGIAISNSIFLGWFIRDHAAHWVRMGVAYLYQMVRAWV